MILVFFFSYCVILHSFNTFKWRISVFKCIQDIIKTSFKSKEIEQFDAPKHIFLQTKIMKQMISHQYVVTTYPKHGRNTAKSPIQKSNINKNSKIGTCILMCRDTEKSKGLIMEFEIKHFIIHGSWKIFVCFFVLLSSDFILTCITPNYEYGNIFEMEKYLNASIWNWVALNGDCWIFTKFHTSPAANC